MEYFPVLIPYYSESHEDTTLLWLRELFFPNPHLKHVMLREDSTSYGIYDVGEN